MNQFNDSTTAASLTPRSRRGRAFAAGVLGLLALTLGLLAVPALRGARGRRVAPPRTPAAQPDPDEMDRKAWRCLVGGDVEGAEVQWRQAAQVDPRRAGPWVQLGRLSLQRRQPDEAVARFNRALELSPESYEAFHGLASAHKLLGHDTEASLFGDRADRARRALPPPTGGMGADAMPCDVGGMH